MTEVINDLGLSKFLNLNPSQDKIWMSVNYSNSSEPIYWHNSALFLHLTLLCECNIQYNKISDVKRP